MGITMAYQCYTSLEAEVSTAITAAPANPYLDDFLAPVSTEVTATDLAVTGHIPDFLDGRYLRNGPNPVAEVDPATYHWFTGEGWGPGGARAAGKPIGIGTAGGA